MVIGLHEQKVPFDFLNLLHREIELKGVFGSYNEFKEVIHLLASGKINTDLLISDVVSLADIVEKGFQQLLGSRDLVKILVKVGDSLADGPPEILGGLGHPLIGETHARLRAVMHSVVQALMRHPAGGGVQPVGLYGISDKAEGVAWTGWLYCRFKFCMGSFTGRSFSFSPRG
jgi:hypothetical protein